MYSYEDRITVIKLYLKYDNSAIGVVRELGYPSAKMLKAWVKNYNEGKDFQCKRPRKEKYTLEQKEVAVAYYLEHGRCQSRTIKSRGYPYGSQVLYLQLKVMNRTIYKKQQ